MKTGHQKPYIKPCRRKPKRSNIPERKEGKRALLPLPRVQRLETHSPSQLSWNPTQSSYLGTSLEGAFVPQYPHPKEIPLVDPRVDKAIKHASLLIFFSPFFLSFSKRVCAPLEPCCPGQSLQDRSC